MEHSSVRFNGLMAILVFCILVLGVKQVFAQERYKFYASGSEYVVQALVCSSADEAAIAAQEIIASKRRATETLMQRAALKHAACNYVLAAVRIERLIPPVYASEVQRLNVIEAWDLYAGKLVYLVDPGSVLSPPEEKS